MKVSAAQIVRALVTLEGKRRWIFNDKTKFGRSIKVWGAPKEFTEGCAAVLEAKGFKVKVVKTPYSPIYLRNRPTYRIHVWEE